MKFSSLVFLLIFHSFFLFCSTQKSSTSEGNAALLLLLTDSTSTKTQSIADLVTTTNSGGVYTSIVNATSPKNHTFLNLKDGGIATTSSGNWDLRMKRFVMSTNSGSSGSGGGGSCFTNTTNFSSGITSGSCSPMVDAIQSQTGGNGFGNANESASPSMFSWYNYDSNTHILSSKQEVYLIRGKDGSFYKLQILDFYSSAGTSGYLTLRWSPL